ncbi:MAG: hypothetical protein GY854_11100 [Deltaproteobacteria bacterium]|nr:hypothetical protein [Deltaproteobacteria bacterium]
MTRCRDLLLWIPRFHYLGGDGARAEREPNGEPNEPNERAERSRTSRPNGKGRNH